MLTAMLEVLLFCSAVAALVLYAVPLRLGAGVVAIALLGLTLLASLSWWFLGLAWVIFLPVAIVAFYPAGRIRYCIQPLLRFFRKALPPMSQTEQEAIEAGDVWWEAQLFSGQPRWHELLAFSEPRLSDKEQAFVDEKVDAVCRMLKDWTIVTVDRDLPKEVWQYLKEAGFFGLTIPTEYGGHGFSALANSTVVSQISACSVSAAVTVMVPNSLGPAELLLHYGTKEQKEYYLPRLASGEDIPCFALTAPQAGSDAGAMPDKGIVCRGQYQGEEVLGLRLTFDKRYITLAPVATVVGLACKVFDPDHLLGDQEALGITLCLLPASHPGVEIGARHNPLGMAFMNGPVRGEDVFIPLDWVIGGPECIGQGWRMLMECLSIGRSISLPALASAVGKLAYRSSGAYAFLRQQFNVPIGAFEGIQASLARIGGYTYLLESSRLLTAQAVTDGIRPSVASAIAKYHMTEMGRTALNDAMDVHAGKGIQLGPLNYLGFHYMAMPVAITVEGANILTRNLMIFGQGAIRCHPYIRKEMAIAANTNNAEALRDFEPVMLSHIGFAVRNAVRSLWYGISGGRFVSVPKVGIATPYLRQLTRMSTALAFVSDVTLLVLGGALKRKEFLSARLGDVLSYLYLGSAAVKYFHSQQCDQEDEACFSWAMAHCLSEIQQALDAFFRNFSIPWIGRLLRWIIFPVGRAYMSPGDNLAQRVAKQMLTPSAFRDRLTQACSTQEGLALVEKAFEQWHQVADSDRILQRARRENRLDKDASLTVQLARAVEQQLLTQEQATAYWDADQLRQKALSVDDFGMQRAVVSEAA